ncbi:MAG TPA: hypothetical protein H9717_13820 [Candidatus Eisenbergiella merdipullorum]|uniref:beta-mannosidase n=1 Tax=Candidatus Eisenbergiella merdipullorum TaxID=2838553 RepID=A0A9D2I953_9FIRM|nr:hypothetical protein [Candidatus Eisenbergiella merdipullorum]
MKKISLNGNDWACKHYVGEDWIWRDGEKRETRDIRWWKPASVPGSVTDDMYRCGEIPDPYFEKNSLLAEWIPERTWIYRKEFPISENLEGKRVYLHLDGVDYDALIFLNDRLIGEHHSMYTPAVFDVTGLLETGKRNLLAVVLNKAPDEQCQVSKTRYVKTHKSRMTYWWDFCPRMIHMGIWKDVWLEITGKVRLSSPDFEVSLNGSLTTASVEGTVVAEGTQRVRAEILRNGVAVSWQEVPVFGDKAAFRLTVKDPELWWPNGYGEQPIYFLHLTAGVTEGKEEDTDERYISFGIRDLKFVPNETEDTTARPYTACINGRKIYLKGYNWVPIDVMYGRKRPEKLRRLLLLAKQAHVNCLRVWGGGLIEREEFYDFCDENGILIWQEFIQSSSGIENEPSQDPEFLELMRREAEWIIPEKKHHPALAIWGGGNELSGPGNRMISMEVPVISILAGQVKNLDPSRYFLESSPTGRMFNNTLENIREDPLGLHDVHGPWEHQGMTAQYTLYNAGTSLLSSEFGVEGMTNEYALLKNMKKEHLWPPSRENEYYFHRGSWWNNYPLLQECFGGVLSDIGTVVRASQFLQYEGLKYAVEANRRRALSCSGTFPWQFNEPYPNNTCTCSVDYYAEPKPAYYGIKKAYAQDVVTAEFASQTWKDKEVFETHIFWQSTEEGRRPARILVRLVGQDGCLYAQEELSCGWKKQEAEKAVCAGKLRCPSKEISSEIFYLLLDACDESGETMAANRYCFTKTTLAPLTCLPKTEVKAQIVPSFEGWILELRNMGGQTAAGLKLEDAHAGEGETRESGYLYFSDNYLYLLPGERTKIRLYCEDPKLISVRIGAFNVEEAVISKTGI